MADFSEFFSQQQNTAPVSKAQANFNVYASSNTVSPVSDLDRKISSLQYEAAKELRSKIDNPQILEFIYSQLPTESMSESDMSAFTNEYTQIKQQVAAASMAEANKAAGQDLDNLVSRGVISQESANRQKLKNKAAVNAVVSIVNKKLDAARIGMARSKYFSDASTGLKTAEITGNIDEQARDIYSSVVSRALSNITHRQGLEANNANRVLDAQLQSNLNKAEANTELIGGLTELAAPLISKLVNSWGGSNTSMYGQGGYEGLGIGNPESYGG